MNTGIRTTIAVMPGNAIRLVIDGREVDTLRDLLPEAPGLKMLFIAKTPAPESVKIGHYFQGKHGREFWRLLKEYGLLMPTTSFEDDSLLDHGYGVTDIVKLPRPFGQEPSNEEYEAGANRILNLIHIHRPKIVVFVYKKVLDQLSHLRFGIQEKSNYGFNPIREPHFGSRVFVFPLPGTPCTKEEATKAMQELAACVLVE